MLGIGNATGTPYTGVKMELPCHVAFLSRDGIGMGNDCNGKECRNDFECCGMETYRFNLSILNERTTYELVTMT